MIKLTIWVNFLLIYTLMFISIMFLDQIKNKSIAINKLIFKNHAPLGITMLHIGVLVFNPGNRWKRSRHEFRLPSKLSASEVAEAINVLCKTIIDILNNKYEKRVNLSCVAIAKGWQQMDTAINVQNSVWVSSSFCFNETLIHYYTP